MSTVGETVFEVDLNALRHNYEYLRSELRPGTKFLAVVKAYAYGHGAPPIALFLEKLGVDYFAVAYTGEGVELREAGVQAPIIVLHPQPVHFEEIIAHRLEPSLYSEEVLQRFAVTAGNGGLREYPVHLKFNTGLNRLGFDAGDVDKVVSFLEQHQAVKPVSLFSHLAASEDPEERDFSRVQISAFKQIADRFEHLAGFRPLLHQCNTSGILCYPEAHFDMVRSGIGLYGYGNDAIHSARLRPIGTLKSVISQLHRLEKGESLGYNRGFIAERPTITATLPLGHADGIGRPYGKGKSHVSVNGQPARILGNVCMDMLMIDVTGIDCSEGDEVIIFGKDPSAEELAATAGTISYELVTAISRRVKRSYKE
ncbi:alanine racemase [Sinomicrobium soli]|uniref:alanine racemase n=1 Tax=Sinomicrobium sp. N-1-3-6 TaxID=2219864 RepID=UPI000DCE5F2A|nr:alanine racemase [Sinomicrobium sp. N-1-3-6]RAV28358.1 alanine racemase [Sinomicrobium sp. N-1-3-6]